MFTVTAPGTQGVMVMGMHGCGVSTPSAAAVAAATIGFEGVMHIANGMMFTIGLWSWMLAAGTLLQFTRLIGNTTNADGAVPKLQVSCAPCMTCCGISRPYVEIDVAQRLMRCSLPDTEPHSTGDCAPGFTPVGGCAGGRSPAAVP